MSLQGDEGDRAAAIQQKDIDNGLKIRRAEGPAPRGICYHCGESVADGLRWCDAECRDAWQRDRNHRLRGGL
jgi:hypothetical protein